ALHLVPATLLFLFAFGLVNRSIDKWFSAPVDEIVQATDELNRQWRSERETFARSILDYISDQADLDLGKTRQNFRLDGLFVVDSSGNILRSSADPNLPLNVITQALSSLGANNEVFFDNPARWIAA